jgi:hypothetical protein
LSYGLAERARRDVPVYADGPLATTETGSGHSFDDAEALAWLRSQPGGTVNASAAQLARTWGWNRVRGPSAPGMADRRLHSKERNAITVNHDVTGGVTNAVTEAVTAMTADRDVTGDVTEAVTDPVTAVTADRDVTGVLRRLAPILLHLLHLLHRFRPY